MPAAKISVTGAPCWVDLMSDDIARCRTFYAELFGWDAAEPDDSHGGYFMFLKDGAPIAGGMPGNQPDVPNVWSIYLTTPDAHKTIEAAGEHGGQTLVPAMEIPQAGTMGVLSDPGGAAIGLWQPGEHKGFPTTGEPGTPGWFELLTRDYQSAIDFYRDVFEWTPKSMGDTDDFRYTVFEYGDDQLAGIMDASAFLPEGVPAHWSVYFSVADTDASIEKLTSLGGSVLQAAQDTPYGRLAAVADPTGAQFKLIGPNTGS